MLSARFSRAVLMIRSTDNGLAKAMKFYQQGLGLQVLRATDEWCELRCENGLRVGLQATHQESHLSTGYGPVLQFTISDMNHTVATLAQHGAHFFLLRPRLLRHRRRLLQTLPRCILRFLHLLQSHQTPTRHRRLQICPWLLMIDVERFKELLAPFCDSNVDRF